MPTLFVSDGRCQFCHSTAADVAHLIAGDSGFICDACVKSCANLLAPAEAAAQPKPEPDRFIFQRLTRHFAPAPDLRAAIWICQIFISSVVFCS